jgi:hypothetical protein
MKDVFRLVKETRAGTRLKRCLVACAATCLTISSATAFSADYSKTEKELRIMTKIFETSISDAKLTGSNPVFSRGGAESMYLAKQGMVFTFGFNSGHFGNANDWQALGEGIGQLVGTIASEVGEAFAEMDRAAPVAPVAPVPSVDWEHNMDAYEAYQEAMEELREQQREKRHEVRELQRNIRDIERQRRRDEGNSGDLEKTKQKLEEKMAELSKKMEVYEKSMNEYREKRLEKVRINNQQKSDLIITTLCDYGATLRSLSSKEYVTVIFKNYENNKDQIYVFNSKNVKSCDSAKNLMAQSINYQL